MDDWHIRIDKRYLHNQAGSGARRKEAELAGERGRVARWLARVFDTPTEDRSWRRGAEGEERVAATLTRCLDASRWAVIHDLTIGSRGANLDHLAIGPGGVFVLNTKNLTGTLKVHERVIYQNGHRTTFVPSLLREVRTVQQRLSVAAGREVSVRGLLVLTGTCTVHVAQRPSDLTVLRDAELSGWFGRLPADRLPPAEVLRLERAARDPDTWVPPATRRRPAAAPPAVRVSGPIEIAVSRWTRHGKDRFYANGPDGVRLGFIDILTGEVRLDVEDRSGAISAQLLAARDAVT